jgi:hypothetical protein
MAYRSVDFVGVVPKKQRTQNRVGKRVVHPLKIQQPASFQKNGSGQLMMSREN